VANKWLEALKSKNTPHNTEEDCAREDGCSSKAGGKNGRTRKKPPVKTAKTPSKNGHTPENVPAKTAKTNGTPTKRVKKKLTPEEEVTHYDELATSFPEYVHTAKRAGEVLEWVARLPEVALDIETYGRLKRDGLLYTRCRVRLLVLHHDGTSYFVDCDRVSDELVVEILSTLKDKPKYLHNAMFDIPRLNRRFGVLLDQNIHDTLIASRVARAGEWERKKGRVTQISHSLNDVLAREIGVEIPKDTRLKWGGLITEEHLRYAGDDISHLKDLHDTIMGVLEENGVKDRYDAVSARLTDFIGAAVRGVPLDAERLQRILDSLESEMEDLRARLDELAPDHPEGEAWVWGNTSKEIAPDGKGRNGALRALSLVGLEISDLQDQTLLDHREGHELARVLYDYRKKANTLARYRKWIPDFYDAETGRLYPQPKVAAAVTGRVLYSDPNAQGIDKKKTDEFRRCVRAPEGRTIVKGDFSQQELRIAAYYSEDRAMLEAFTNGEDIYLRTAAKLVGEERAVEARPAAKRATLGFLYGLGVDKYRTNVYKDTGEPLSGDQAVKDRQAFRAAFPTFYNWQKRYGARKEWETRSVLGWRRVVSPSKDREGNTVPKYTERLNGPIQSTAGDILYLTLEKMAADPRPGVHFLLSVHDEIVLECSEEDAREVALWLKEKMRSSIEDVLGKDLGGEKSVEVSYGPSWGETTEGV
jgi:DNA polymerase I-like protein with 3'-5' exonuclease and polymerase domains